MQLITLLKLGRVSNLPTVWSNLLGAFFISSFFNESEISWRVFFILMVAFSLIYIAGMYLNDAFDASWDRKHNNLRPIIMGEIKEKIVWIIGIFLLLLGVLSISTLQNFFLLSATLALVIFILLYNALHKEYSFTSFLMGACRGFIYLITALAIGEVNPTIWIFIGGLILYVTGITYLARGEHTQTLSNRYSIIFLFSPAISILLINLSWQNLIGAFLFTLWIVITIIKYFKNSGNIKKGIGTLLASIPLIDALFLFSINAFFLAFISIGIFFIMPYLHRYISGT